MKHIPFVILFIIIILFIFANNCLAKKEKFYNNGPQYYCGLYNDSKRCNSDGNCSWSVVSGTGTTGTKTQTYNYCTVKPVSS